MSIAVVGEALIDFIVGSDGAYRPHLGGSPYNVAIGLARQGIKVSYLSPLSNDTFGDQFHNALRNEHVDIPVTRRSLCPTSLALVTIDEQGLPNYRLYREGIADKDTSFEEIVANLPDDLAVFHTGSLAITPSQLPMMRKLFDLMHKRGVMVSIDINIRLRASLDTQAYLNGVRSLLRIADIVKASDEDLDALGFDSDPRKNAERAFAELGSDIDPDIHPDTHSGILLLTEGRGGAVLYTARGTIKKSAYPIANIEDTVGAGDTFHSAFLATLCRSGSLRGALRDIDPQALGDAVDFACAAAAINVSRVGCSPPTQQEVVSFIASTRR